MVSSPHAHFSLVFVLWTSADLSAPFPSTHSDESTEDAATPSRPRVQFAALSYSNSQIHAHWTAGMNVYYALATKSLCILLCSAPRLPQISRPRTCCSLFLFRHHLCIAHCLTTFTHGPRADTFAMSSVAQSDDSPFGSQLPGPFDFTVLFEHAMLGLIPTALVVFVTPFYLKDLLHTQRQVRPGNLLWSKLACGLALVAIQATNIMLWHKTGYLQSRVTVATSIMSLVASSCTMAIIIVTHIYSLQPSSFLTLLFSLTMIFDITMARSCFVRDTLSAIATLQVCIAILKLFLIILEEVSKRGLYLSQEQRSAVSAETASGFWNRSFFVWLNPLLVFGWRNHFTIDNFPSIGEEFESERLFDRFSHHWIKGTVQCFSCPA